MAHAHAADDHAHGHYIAPTKLLLGVFGALVVLTILTAITGKADWIPSWMHVPLALAIAAVKTALVVAIFMGLKHDNRVNTVVFVLSGIFVSVFLAFTLFDTANRGDLGNVDSMTAADRAALLEQDTTLLARYRNLPVAPGDSARVDTTGLAPLDSAAADTASADGPSAPSTEAPASAPTPAAPTEAAPAAGR